MGKLILVTLVAVAGLRAQTPAISAMMNGTAVARVAAPGDVVSIFGHDFGTVETTAVTVGRWPAQVLYAGPSRVVARLPRNLPSGPTTLLAAVEDRVSEPFKITIALRSNEPVLSRRSGVSPVWPAKNPGVPGGPSPALPRETSGAPSSTVAPLTTGGSPGIVYTCDPTVTAKSATACTVLNTTIAALYRNAFSNANAFIYITLGSTDLGQSDYSLNLATYTTFRNALIASATSANDHTAITGSVPAANPFNGEMMALPNGLSRALGLPVAGGMDSHGNLSGCTPGTAGCYDGIITVANNVGLYFRTGAITNSQFDFFTVAEHETDEILGTASCANFGCGTFPSYGGPPDLFRYSSNGARTTTPGANNSCSSSDSTNACFSLDGVHMLQQYNNLDNGDDLGDWAPTGCANTLVQDAELCSGVANVDISPTAEILVLDVIGYTLTSAGTGAVSSVTSTTANGTYGVGASLSIQVIFNESVTVTGAPQLALNSGGTAGYVSGSGSSTLTFTYTVAAGQNSARLDYASTGGLTLNGGTILGPGSSAVSLTLAAPGAAGSLSGSTNIVINTNPPAAVTVFSPAQGVTGVALNASLTWGAAGGATSYDVYFGTSPSPPFVANTATLSYSPSMNNGTTYYWKITSRNSNGATPSVIWLFTTAAVQAPAAVTVFSPAQGATGVALNTSLTWGAASGATSYDVYFGTSTSPPFVTNTAGLTYSPSMTAGTTYYWQITSRNAGGTTPSVVWLFTTVPAAPAAVTVFSPAQGATGVALNSSLTWGAAGRATSYDVYFGTSTTPGFVTNTMGLSYSPPSMAAGTTYYWYITSRNSGGTTQSALWLFTTATAVQPPAAVTVFTPAQGATGVAVNTSLTWGPASGATSYDVYFGTSTSPPFVMNTAGLTYTPPPMAAGTTYYWQITSRNAGGTTPSVLWLFTTATAVQPPAAVTVFTPTQGATGVAVTASLTWGAANGATSYDVYFGTSTSPPFVTNTTQLSYTPPAMAAGTIYYWQIASRNSAGATPSALWLFSTSTSGQAPGAVTVFSPAQGATGVSTSASLTWGAAGGATSYDVYFGASPSPPFATNTAGLSYTPASLAAGTTYYWQITSRNSAGTTPSAVWSFTTSATGQPPAAVTVFSPAQGASGVAINATLTWGAAGGATSYDVYFGTSVTPPFVTNTAGLSYAAPAMAGGTTYYWQITARNSAGTTPSAVWLFTTAATGQLPGAVTIFSPGQGVTGVPLNATLTWGASAATTSYDVYFGTSVNPPLIGNTTNLSFSPGALAPGTTYYWLTVSRNSAGTTASALWFFTTAAGQRFIPVAPCRIMDTRQAAGPFGGPAIFGGTTRNVPIPQSACNIPSTALAYSLNVTVAPPGPLDYLSIWPAGQTQPVVSTLNSLDGRIVANAAIVPAGTSGAISVFASDTTQAIVDINGYFAPASTSGSLSFYAVTPCRIVDTRGAAGQFGGPFLNGGSTRSFAIGSSPCGTLSGAQAYSLNITVVPHAPLQYLTTWPAGQSQPLVSTLNSLDGGIVANAAIVPAGTGGGVSFFVTNDTDLIVDINGYFAPPGGAGALSLYPLTPCRVADTRTAAAPFGGPSLGGNTSRSFTVPASACAVSATAQAYSLNVTVVPPNPLTYLTAWPSGVAQPVVSTLNSLAGKIVANAAIVPAGATPTGAVSIYVSNATDLILDINAYFGQ